jgi:hypothetical protein
MGKCPSQSPKDAISWADWFKLNVILFGLLGSSGLAVWMVETFWLPLGNFSALLYVGILLFELGLLLKIVQWCIVPYLAHETVLSLEDECKLRVALQQATVQRSARNSREPEKYALFSRTDASARAFDANFRKNALANDTYPARKKRRT